MKNTSLVHKYYQQNALSVLHFICYANGYCHWLIAFTSMSVCLCKQQCRDLRFKMFLSESHPSNQTEKVNYNTKLSPLQLLSCLSTAVLRASSRSKKLHILVVVGLLYISITVISYRRTSLKSTVTAWLFVFPHHGVTLIMSLWNHSMNQNSSVVEVNCLHRSV